MAKAINNKCLECSKTSRIGIRKVKPDCYNISICAHRRSYYRQLEHYRAKAREYHRYIKFMGNKCLVCGSTDKLEGHHHISQVSGGEDIKDNIVTLCSVCHNIITIYNRRLGIERKLLD